MKLNRADYVQLQSGVEKKKNKYGKKLYHYTSLNTFFSMIQKREIWMSSTGSMNDRKETLYFIEMMERELTSYGRKDFFEKVYTQIPLNYKYAFCLSTEDDDAAQWERYGDSAMGVCLAFNVEELYKCLYGYPNIMFNKVFYSDSVVDGLYFRIVKNYFETGKIDVYSSEEELIKQLIYAGNLNKHKSFKNEHEIRIITLDNKNQYGTEYALKEIGNVVKKVFILRPDIMGHSKGTCFDNLIDEVIIGPRSQQNKSILEQYIFVNGLQNTANKVTMSDCPLR
jgi:hypothetical protein